MLEAELLTAVLTAGELTAVLMAAAAKLTAVLEAELLRTAVLAAGAHHW